LVEFFCAAVFGFVFIQAAQGGAVGFDWAECSEHDFDLGIFWETALHSADGAFSLDCGCGDSDFAGVFWKWTTREKLMTREFDVPESLLKRAEELANEDGVSLDKWVSAAVAQKIGAVETAAEFFRNRSKSAGKGLLPYLDMIPAKTQMQGDELPRT
jgi:hypothetical protein